MSSWGTNFENFQKITWDTKTITCYACMADYPGWKCYKLTEICDHNSCENCLYYLLSKAINDDTLWPINCCKIEIDFINLAKSVMGLHDFKALMQKSVIINCKNFMYCQEKTCSEFINLDKVDGLLVDCEKCGKSHCSKCKGLYHGKKPCP